MSAEAKRSFPCFGGTVSVRVAGSSGGQSAEEAVDRAQAMLLDAHRRLSRFLPDSELVRLNSDSRRTVPVSALMLKVAAAAHWAGTVSGGLVDATLLGDIERAGYADSLAGNRDRPGPGRAPASESARPASASPRRDWSRISVDRADGTVSRPPGVRIDSGGLGKGLLADVVGEVLAGHPAYAVDCCGDVRIGGAARRPRRVLVDDPAGGEPLHELTVVDGGVATSGIWRRSWQVPGGGAAHHLLDPVTGRPAFTGVVQATALAPTALLAEVRAKHALLSGPELGRARLPGGGVLVLEDGSVLVVEPEASEQPLQAA